jgi:hypothetical protein
LGADDLLANGIDKEMKFLEEIVQLPEFVDRIICVNKSDLLSDQERGQITQSKSV